MCGPLCPEKQRHILKLSCPKGFPQISFTEGNRSQNLSLLDRPSSPRAVGHPCNLGQGQKSVPLYVVKVDGKSWQTEANAQDHRDLSPPEPGIRNPTVCLQTNDTLAFLVTREHYPEYDLGHFYNTLEQFDWGRFRALAEEAQLSEKSSRLFLQQFQLPGVYVFRLSSNQHRKMIHCHRLSWTRKAPPHPTFRIHQQGYNLNAYSSSRTGVPSVRRGQSHQDSDAPSVERVHSGSWEAEEQVDLEWFDAEAFFRILFKQSLTVTTKLSQTKEEVMLQEGHRLKAWGFLGTGTGAELLQPAAVGPQGSDDYISMNPITKLMVPGPNCAMLPASGHAGPIPPGYFIHPDTGRVLPEAGNLGYDLLSATLVPTTDSNAGGVRTSEAAILPYVPYPTSPATGCPPPTNLPALQPRRTSQLGALMTDPLTGIEVPVLAVTLHPQTRQWLTLGGTYCNPLTKTLAPLELGGPMEDPVTGGILPILGVGLDENTGLLAPLSAVLPPFPPCLA
ncbi:hypothetical protein GHT09_004663 [Marmota monax]|uniref:Uncharacterized protein n=1 Tax=Marmota monax TaxID=9995 RepID=A0A834QQN3_MARMO|nr:hypothetical protein GHT09_004663 [Marmota monax]